MPANPPDRRSLIDAGVCSLGHTIETADDVIVDAEGKVRCRRCVEIATHEATRVRGRGRGK